MTTPLTRKLTAIANRSQSTRSTTYVMNRAGNIVSLLSSSRVTLVANLSGSGRVKHATHEGREYLVAPITLIVEGVLNGSNGPLYYPVAEIARNYRAWNNVPLTLYHPFDPVHGGALAARDPGVLERQGIGFLRNARVETNKLKADGWFDVAKCNALDATLVGNLQQGNPIEISTGLYTYNEQRNGSWKGKPYEAIARDYQPDHLAILPTQIGACSLRDGCGVLANANPEGCNQYRGCGGGSAASGRRKLAATKAGKLTPEQEAEVQARIKQHMASNAFCPTGEGGGMDNSCSSRGGGEEEGGSGSYEQSLSGEYWLDGGQALFADGDIGDMNHEGYAIQQAQSDVAEAFGVDHDPEGDWDTLREKIVEEHPDMERIFDEDNKPALDAKFKELGIDEETWHVAQGNGQDARIWAADKHDWVRVQGNSVQMVGIDGSKLSGLADGLYDAHGEDVERQSFDIEVIVKDSVYTNHLNTKLYREVPYHVIASGDIKRLREYTTNEDSDDASGPVTACCGQGAKVMSRVLRAKLFQAAKTDVKPTENVIRKLPNGQYRLHKADGTGNLGTFDSLEAAKQHEREVEYFKHVKNKLRAIANAWSDEARQAAIEARKGKKGPLAWKREKWLGQGAATGKQAHVSEAGHGDYYVTPTTSRQGGKLIYVADYHNRTGREGSVQFKRLGVTRTPREARLLAAAHHESLMATANTLHDKLTLVVNGFASEEQRRFMWSQEPEIAQEWAHDRHSSPGPDHKMPDYGKGVAGPLAKKMRKIERAKAKSKRERSKTMNALRSRLLQVANNDTLHSKLLAVANGDSPGHPFRGNQHGSAQSLSVRPTAKARQAKAKAMYEVVGKEAEEKSIVAEHRNDIESHKAAIDSHQRAHEEALRANLPKDQEYHRGMKEKHRAKIDELQQQAAASHPKPDYLSQSTVLQGQQEEGAKRAREQAQDSGKQWSNTEAPFQGSGEKEHSRLKGMRRNQQRNNVMNLLQSIAEVVNGQTANCDSTTTNDSGPSPNNIQDSDEVLAERDNRRQADKRRTGKPKPNAASPLEPATAATGKPRNLTAVEGGNAATYNAWSDEAREAAAEARKNKSAGKPGGVQDWHTFAGGTSAPEGSNAFMGKTEHGEYHIQPYTRPGSKRAGYRVSFAHTNQSPGHGLSGGLWHDVGQAYSAKEAKGMAYHHHATTQWGTPKPPATNRQQGETSMGNDITLNAEEREATIDGLINNKSGCCFNEAERPLLERMSDLSLSRLYLKLNEESAGEYDAGTEEDDKAGLKPRGGASGKGKNESQADGKVAPLATPELDPKYKTENTMSTQQVQLSPEDQAFLNFGRQEMARRRAALVANVKASTNQFTDDDLKAMPDDMLVKLSASFQRNQTAQEPLPNFFGQAAPYELPVANAEGSEKDVLPDITLNFANRDNAGLAQIELSTGEVLS